MSMTSGSTVKRPRNSAADYGHARAQYFAYEAVMALWRRRAAEGMKQADIAKKLNRDTAWVSRALRGPGNWTLRTLGELIEALDGELEIAAEPLSSPGERGGNRA